MNVLLKALLEGIVPVHLDQAIEVHGLSSDSRQVTAGDLFFSCLSVDYDAPDYRADHIQEAIARGAVAVLVEESNPIETPVAVPIIPVIELRQLMGLIAARFYQNPSKDMLIIAVTGTNGKTSTAHFLARMYQAMGKRCGVIGTMGCGLFPELEPSDRTTPDPIRLHSLLAQMRAAQAEVVVMEASSHGLDQSRLVGVNIDVGIFTNLSHDHMDYHKHMRRYARSKKILFDQEGLRIAVLNFDDPFGRSWGKALATTCAVIGYGSIDVAMGMPYVQIRNATLHQQGMTAEMHTPWGTGMCHSALLGRFNLDNLTAVLTTLCALGHPLEEVLAQLSALKPIPGRMHIVGDGKNMPLVVVDYAHTPDALKKALTTLRAHYRARIWCVVGCGGDRDKSKRSMMGQIGARYSDHFIVTDDNPRRENPKDITQQIIQGLFDKQRLQVIHDRRSAIMHAIQQAGDEDIVFIAGKGHEKYQVVGDHILPFDDVQVAQDGLAKRAASIS